jgi:hypothetical protein
MFKFEIRLDLTEIVHPQAFMAATRSNTTFALHTPEGMGGQQGKAGTKPPTRRPEFITIDCQTLSLDMNLLLCPPKLFLASHSRQLPDGAFQPITGSCPALSLYLVRIPCNPKQPSIQTLKQFRYWLVLINNSVGHNKEAPSRSEYRSTLTWPETPARW